MAIKEYKLRDISFVKNGNKNKEDQIIDGKYNFYTRSKQILRSNDYSIDGNYIIIPGEGIFDPMWNSGKAAIHQRVYYISTNENICKTKYLYYWYIKNNDILYKNAVGTTVKSLRLRNFLDPEIQLPDLQTQQKIINIIEPFEKLRKQINDKKELISKICFFEIINSKPQKTMIENEIIFEKGKNVNSIDLVNNFTNLPFINVSAINNKINKFISSPYIKKNVEYGDVILSLDGTIGLVNNFLEGYNGYGYKVFSKNNAIDNSIIYFSLLNPINQKIIFENSNGSVIKHASKSKNKILLFNFLNENLIRMIFKYDIVLKIINKNINKVIEKLINLFIF